MIITQETIFYGPHPCDRCQQVIVKSSRESGGMEFDYPVASPPHEPIYPNTVWHTHRCAGYGPPSGAAEGGAVSSTTPGFAS